MEQVNTTSQRLLVVEDNAINRLVVTRMLELSGYVFDVAETGEDGLNLLDSNDYALVLTDISMPGMDGLELARRIRARPDAKKDIPVIAMTANAGLGDQGQFKTAGINAVVPKPFTRAVLNDHIRKWLEPV